MASEASKELEIPIWVKGTQKWVTGLTKRTTCDDVIYALLYNDGLQEHINTAAYALFEKWREVERPLQGRTKVVKVWRAWGAEQCNVYLSMKKIDELEYSGEFSLTRRKKRSRHKTRDRDREQDREKHRHSREHRHHHGYYHSTSERLRSMETLVKLVISQERRLKDLTEHADDIDKLIDKYESRMNSSRLKQSCEDIVQDTYLDSYGDEGNDSMDDLFSKANVEELEMYVDYCDKIIVLEDKVDSERSKAEELAYQIQQCVNDKNTHADARTSECEMSQVQVGLNRAVSCAIMQQYKFQDLQRELQFYEDTLKAREEVYKRLQMELITLETADKSFTEETHKNQACKNAMKHTNSSDPVTALNPPPLPERTKRPQSVEHTKPISFQDQETSHAIPEITHYGICDSQNSLKTFSDAVFDRKPILKQTCKDLKTCIVDETPPVNTETKVRFKTTSLVDRYQWDESSLSEGISIDHSDCSDSKDLFECMGKRDNYSLIKPGLPDKPYLTVKVEDNDSNSDTGLSSMHSDDSAVYHLETLV